MKTATNPQTGQKIYWDGEQWLPLKTATNKETGEVIAMKKMKKSEMLYKN